MHKGDRVERLTKKVGQTAPTGRVIAFRDEHYIEVQWDDGHTSLVSRDGVAPITDANRPHKGT